MSTKTPARRRKVYSQPEIDAALAVLASSGSSLEASERTGIPSSTLRDWKLEHHERYREIQEREAPKLEAIAAAQAREIMIRAGEVEHELLDTLHGRISDYNSPPPDRQDFDDPDEYVTAYKIWQARVNTKELGDLAGAFQKTATAKGINGTKLLELTGRPTQIIEHRDPREDLRGLARDLGLSIPGTAVDITPRTERTALPAKSVDANARELQPAERAAD